MATQQDESIEAAKSSVGLGGSQQPQQSILAAPLSLRTSRSQPFPPGWDAPSTPMASTNRLPPITTAPQQYALSFSQANQSPFSSPVASSGTYSGFTTTPTSEVSTSSSISSVAGGDKRIFMPMSSIDPTPICTPYQGFYSPALDNEPRFGTPFYPNGPAPLASAPILNHTGGNGYFDLGPSSFDDHSPLQLAIANFERLFGNWRMWIDGGRATDPGAAQLRGQMDMAFTRMMDLSREKDALIAREGRKRVNSISSTPNPAPIKLRRESNASGMRPPPLIHAHTSPIVPLAPSATSPTLPAFIAKASSSNPAAQATVDGVHFSTTTSPTAIVVPSPVQHTPHTPSPLSAGIVAPVLLQAETQLNSALANGLPSSISAPSSPRLRSELAQALYEPATATAASPATARQPPNPRIFDSPSEAGSSTQDSASPMTLVQPSVKSSSSTLASQAAEDADLVIGSPHEVKEETEDDDDDTMSVDMPARKNGPLVSTGVGAAEPVALSPGTKAALDRLMVHYLNKLCNDFEITDNKGELVHQKLMGIKMEKLTEAGEFRPFKFRIQAFTNAFSEEITKASIDEKEVTYKVLRQYLWQHPLISRFNEEGKKAKSKGNHIWTIEARRDEEGVWHFQDFPRRIIVPTQKALHPDAEFSWQPRIWDPQGVVHDATYEVNNLPTWIAWHPKRHEYVGTVPVDAHGPLGPIEVVAKYEFAGAQQELRKSFYLTFTTDERATRSRAASNAVRPAQSPIATHVASPVAFSRPPTQANSPESATVALPHFDLEPLPSSLEAVLSQVSAPGLDPMLTDPLHDPMADLADFLPADMTPLATPSALAPIQQLAVSPSILGHAPMATIGIAPSALTAAAVVSEPSLGDLLAPINLLKEEMSVVEQRPGPIESAVMRHSEMQQTLAAGPSPAVALQALDQLQEAQQQVSQAISVAQGQKLQDLMTNEVTQSPIQATLTGTLAPPPTPVVGIDPARANSMHFMQ